MGQAAVDYVIDFIHGLSEAPARNVDGALEAALALKASPPEEGGSFEEVFAQFRDAAARAYETCGPGYLPYVPGGGLYASALGQFLAMSVNRFPNLWEVAPGLVQIEQNVIRWLCDLFGYPEEARGILTTGGSIANLSAVVTARHVKLGEDFGDGTYYVSEQAHASVPKAAAIAGMPRRAMRLVPVDAELRMDAEALKSMVAEDRAAGPPAVPRRPRRGDHEHRRDRSDGRGGRRRGGRGPVDARRRRLRRLLPSHRAGPGALPRDRARRLDHARPPQGDVPSLRDGLPRRPRRRRAPRRPLRRRGVPPGPSARGGAAELERVLAGAVEGPSRASACGCRSSSTAWERSGRRWTRSSTSRSTCTRRSPRSPRSSCPGRRSSPSCRSGSRGPPTTRTERSSSGSTSPSACTCPARRSRAATSSGRASSATARIATGSTRRSRSSVRPRSG